MFVCMFSLLFCFLRPNQDDSNRHQLLMVSSTYHTFVPSHSFSLSFAFAPQLFVLGLFLLISPWLCIVSLFSCGAYVQRHVHTPIYVPKRRTQRVSGSHSHPSAQHADLHTCATQNTQLYTFTRLACSSFLSEPFFSPLFSFVYLLLVVEVASALEMSRACTLAMLTPLSFTQRFDTPLFHTTVVVLRGPFSSLSSIPWPLPLCRPSQDLVLSSLFAATVLCLGGMQS